MSSPVQNRITGIFIHVTDIQRSRQWYSDLLGLPVESQPFPDHIYVVPTRGGSELILDSNHPEHHRPSSIPLFMFDTDDIDKSFEYLTSKKIETLGGIQRHEPVSFFKDPDGNLLMVCQQHSGC